MILNFQYFHFQSILYFKARFNFILNPIENLTWGDSNLLDCFIVAHKCYRDAIKLSLLQSHDLIIKTNKRMGINGGYMIVN